MPRAKDRPILFEVIERNKTPRPTGNSTTQSNTRPKTTPPRKDAKPDTTMTPFGPPRTSAIAGIRSALSKIVPTRGNGDSTSKPAEPSQPQRPADWTPLRPERSAEGAPAQFNFRIAGRSFSMTWVGLVGVAAALVVSTVAIYQIGVRIKGSSGANGPGGVDPIDQLVKGPANPSAAEVPSSERRGGNRLDPARPPSDTILAADASPATGNATQPASEKASVGEESFPATQRQKGLYYIIVQHFQKSRMADAVAAGRFLQSSGIACGVVASSADIRLIASEAFQIDQKDRKAANAEQARCNELKRRIRDLGRQYARTGRYAFDQCYQDKY